MASIEEIERITGFERRPSESVSEYLSRLGGAAGVDEGEIDAVRETIHTELYAPDPLPEERRERVRAFAETVADRASAADVEAAGAADAGRGVADRTTGGSGAEARTRDQARARAGADGDAASTLESLAGRWDDASGSTRRKVLAGVGVAGTLGVGAAAAGMGVIGGTGDDGNYVAGRPSTTVAVTPGEGGSVPGDADADADADPDATASGAAEPDRTTLAASELAVEPFELRVLDRPEWPQRTPEVCRVVADRLSSVPNLVYGEGASGIDPLASARRLLEMLNCYRETGESAYLEKATEVAGALYDAGESVGDGVFLPYGSAVEPHEDGNEGIDWTVTDPWYSATAQGVALSAFARLYVATESEAARQYAESVLRSFDSIVTRADGESPAEPWVACADGEYLWLEEYSRLPASHVLSAHGYAAWGLYELWAATGSELAAELFRASATTVRERAEAFRNPDEPSDFCLGHGVQRPAYHRIHVRQLRTFHELTGDDAFEALAREFEADYDPS